ncbi:MAG: hypothetical protein J6Y08_08710 [Clostridiales bacterium]|nr:hypothetical protein [Clostridiales bacterium]
MNPQKCKLFAFLTSVLALLIVFYCTVPITSEISSSQELTRIQKLSIAASANVFSDSYFLQDQIEEDTDADTPSQKTLLTETILRNDYAEFQKTNAKMVSLGKKIFGGILLGALVIGILSFVFVIIRRVRQGKNISILLIIEWVVPIVGVLVMFIATSMFFSKATVPDVDKAQLKVYHINVTHKAIEKHYSSNDDSTPTEHHVLYYNDSNEVERSIIVTTDMYDTVTSPGYYYIVAAYDENMTNPHYFAVYSFELYEYKG